MGSRGPVPKRTDQRRRTNQPVTPVAKPAAGVRSSGEIPEADDGWHQVSKSWYASLAKSGQSVFYEPSDWALAFLIAESMSRDLSPQFVGITEQGDSVMETIPLKGASLSAYLKAMNALLVTEGDRRRMSVELQKPKPADPDEQRAGATITDLRARLGG